MCDRESLVMKLILFQFHCPTQDPAQPVSGILGSKAWISVKYLYLTFFLRHLFKKSHTLLTFKSNYNHSTPNVPSFGADFSMKQVMQLMAD